MATIKFGVIVTDARGKLNGNQFSRNRSGAILQVKCQQRQGATPAQSLFRSQFGTLGRYWRTLTPTQQAANNAASVAYPYTDKYGDTRYFTGYQLLLRSNINRSVSGLGPIEEVPATPPAGFSLSSVAASAVVSGVDDVEFNVTWSPQSGAPTDYSTQLFIGNQVSAGINNYSGSYIFYAANDAGNGLLGFVSADYPPANSWVIGNAVFSKLVVIHAPSGIEVGSYINKSIISSS